MALLGLAMNSVCEEREKRSSFHLPEVSRYRPTRAAEDSRYLEDGHVHL